MIKRNLLAALASMAIAASAQTNSPAGPGFLSRAQQMLDDGNYIGCLDQLGRARQLPLSDSEQELAAYLQGAAAVHTDKAHAARLLTQFLDTYPASVLRNDARLDLADCYTGRQALDLYLAVDPEGLSTTRRQDLYYRMACAYLDLGQCDAAQAYLDRVGNPKRYASAIKFYNGYIAYAKGDYQKALQLLSQARSDAAPGNMADYYLSQIYYMQHDWKQAIAAAKQALGRELSPSASAEAYRIIGESSFEIEDFAQSLKYLKAYTAMTSDPKPSAMYILGFYSYQASDYKQAIQYLQAATKGDDAMAQSAYLYMGQALMDIFDYDGAILAFDHALSMDCDKSVQETAFYNYAVASLHGGKVPFGSTVGTFESFLRRYPDSQYAPQVQNYVITSYFNDRDYAGALKSIGEMKNPTSETYAAKQRALYLLGAQTLAQGKAQQAIQYLEQALTLAKYDAEVACETKLALGEACYRIGQYDKSQAYLSQYLSQAPARAVNRPIAMYDLGYTLFSLKQYQQAAKYFQDFVEAEKKVADNKAGNAILADANCRLGDCYYYANQYGAAAKAYDQAFELNPTVGDYALFQKALMEGYQRHHSQKITLLKQLQDQYPASALIPDAMLEMTASYIQLGDHDKAIAIYQQLVAEYPNTAQGRQGYLQMALTLLNRGQKSRAIEAYKQVISRYPTSEEAQLAADQLKRIAAGDGTLNEYIAFINSVPNAPKIDPNEVEALAFEAAEKDYITKEQTQKLQAYVRDYATESIVNPAHAAKALSYLAESAYGLQDTENAYEYASRLIQGFPDNSLALDALVIKGNIDEQRRDYDRALQTWTMLQGRASAATLLDMAHMGVARNAARLDRHDLVIEAASAALGASTLTDADRYQALCLRGQAHHASGDEAKARADWADGSANPADENSMHSSFLLAQSYYDAGELENAEAQAKATANAPTPHIYWMARSFILLSDVYRAQGNDYKASQYLTSLRNNYPGSEPDIFQMIDERLDQ